VVRPRGADASQCVTQLPRLTALNLDDNPDRGAMSAVICGTATTSSDLGDAITSEELQTLTPLSALPALEYLRLAELPLVNDLTPLSALTSLRRLAVNAMPRITDVTPLATLTQLESLQLVYLDAIADLAPIVTLHALKALTLDSLPALHSIAFTAGLGTLENVRISNCANIDTITPLAAATAIRYITLRNLPHLDVAPLAALPHLEQIGVTQSPPPIGLNAFDPHRTRVYDPDHL
jgi:hypothetical protein